MTTRRSLLLCVLGLAPTGAAVAQVAGHVGFGDGCYDLQTCRSVYQRFPDAMSSHLALQGTAVTFTPVAGGYLLERQVVAYVPPTSSAQLLSLADDDDVDVPLAQPFPHLDGPVSTLSVCSNGFVTVGPSGFNPTIANGSVPSLLTAPLPSFRSNTDLDPTAGGGVFAEQVGGKLLITFADVARWNGPGTERFQFQFDLTSGVVAIVWDQMTVIGGAPMIVGYGAGAPSADCGGIDLANDLPQTTGPDVQMQAVAISAAPAPISTATSGTQVVYTMTNVPDVLVNSGLRFGVVVVAFTGDAVGLDLTFLGAPGCRSYVGGLDLLIGFVDTLDQSTISVMLDIPPGVPPGTELFSQAVARFVPNSLPDGSNDFGAVTSNALRSTISFQ